MTPSLDTFPKILGTLSTLDNLPGGALSELLTEMPWCLGTFDADLLSKYFIFRSSGG